MRSGLKYSLVRGGLFGVDPFWWGEPDPATLPVELPVVGVGVVVVVPAEEGEVVDGGVFGDAERFAVGAFAPHAGGGAAGPGAADVGDDQGSALVLVGQALLLAVVQDGPVGVEHDRDHRRFRGVVDQVPDTDVPAVGDRRQPGPGLQVLQPDGDQHGGVVPVPVGQVLGPQRPPAQLGQGVVVALSGQPVSGASLLGWAAASGPSAERSRAAAVGVSDPRTGVIPSIPCRPIVKSRRRAFVLTEPSPSPSESTPASTCLHARSSWSGSSTRACRASSASHRSRSAAGTWRASAGSWSGCAAHAPHRPRRRPPRSRSPGSGAGHLPAGDRWAGLQGLGLPGPPVALPGGATDQIAEIGPR